MTAFTRSSWHRAATKLGNLELSGKPQVLLKWPDTHLNKAVCLVQPGSFHKKGYGITALNMGSADYRFHSTLLYLKMWSQRENCEKIHIKPCPNGKCLVIEHEQRLFTTKHFQCIKMFMMFLCGPISLPLQFIFALLWLLTVNLTWPYFTLQLY